MKPQYVRLVDVFLLGPFMIWFGYRSTLPAWPKLLMMAAGVGTIAYNGRNYLIRRGGPGRCGPWDEPQLVEAP